MKTSMRSWRTTILVAGLLLLPGSILAQEETQPPPKKPTDKPASQTASQPKVIVSAQILVDPSGNKEELLVLRNDTGKEMKVFLNAEVTSTTNANTLILFKGEHDTGPGENSLPLTVPANGSTKVRAVISGVTSAGEFEADLKNMDQKIGTIKGARLPFAVTLDSINPEKFALVDGQPVSIIVKNEDPATYPLIWRLSVNEQELCGDESNLAASGQGVLPCTPSVPFQASRIQDFFKAQDGKGRLLLYPKTPNGNIGKSSPWKIIPLEASMSSFGPFTQQFWGYLTIVLVLLLGGLTSLVLSQALPNRLKRLNIRERLKGTAETTANLGSNVDSRLQVMLRVERSRLYDLLESRNTFSPDFAGVATRSSEGVTKLESRVALVHQIDLVLGQLDQALPLGPPLSQIGEIAALIDDAKVLLAKTQPNDTDLAAAQIAITEAAKKVEALNKPDPTFGQNLAKRALEVKGDIDANISTDPVFVKLHGSLPGPYDELKRIPAAVTEITADKYSSIDMAVEKILIMKKYVLLQNGTTDQVVQDRLSKWQGKLLAHLALESWPAMRAARLLVREMKDDIYPDRLANLLEAKAASIDMDPSVAYDKAPLQFCVCFNNEAVNGSAAREEWTCQWSFGDALKESGWTASHYFLLPRTSRFKKPKAADFTVSASFRNPDGDVLLDKTTNQPLVIERAVTVRPSRQEGFFGDRSRTELLKLVAALFIAVFALVAGAKEELLKLDILPGLIAIFLVGFGADTIKNLLTSKSETAP